MADKKKSHQNVYSNLEMPCLCEWKPQKQWIEIMLVDYCRQNFIYLDVNLSAGCCTHSHLLSLLWADRLITRSHKEKRCVSFSRNKNNKILLMALYQQKLVLQICVLWIIDGQLWLVLPLFWIVSLQCFPISFSNMEYGIWNMNKHGFYSLDKWAFI